MPFYGSEQLQDTYKQCKAQTKRFTDWLYKTASNRGLEPNISPERNSKYTIPLREIITLTQEVAQSGPISDTSGFEALSGAISLRKEVTEWFRFNFEADVEHPFFIGILEKAKKTLLPSIDPRLEDKHGRSHQLITVHLNQNLYDALGNNEIEEANEPASNIIPPNFDWDGILDLESSEESLSVSKHSRDLSHYETELDRKFALLCLLYDFNATRNVVERTWMSYTERETDLVTAAITTDTAMGVIKRNTNSFIEEFEDGTEKHSLNHAIKDLYASIAVQSAQSSNDDEKRTAILRSRSKTPSQLLCIEAISHIEAYHASRTKEGPKVSDKAQDLPRLPFLKLFDRLRSEDNRPPVADNFTASMLYSDTGSKKWLPFGLQILFDIQDIIERDIDDVLDDLVSDSVDLVEKMMDHCYFEGDMWKSGSQPDYFTVQPAEFSKLFLPPSDKLLKWLRYMTDVKHTGDNLMSLIVGQPVLGGIVLQHYRKLYQTTSINKTSPIITALIHLYNAARQTGQLKEEWPDMEYIIQMHGDKTLFLGDPPKEPQEFLRRLQLALGTSLTSFAKDQSKSWIRANNKRVTQHGLLTYTSPLQEKIHDYHYAKQEDKWQPLHNIFAHIIQKDDDKIREALEVESQVQSTFSDIANTLRKEDNKKRRKKGKKSRKTTGPKSSIPEFKVTDAALVEPLESMKIQLTDLELHSRFDYLSFYRRCFALIQRIKNDVLYINGTSPTDLTRLDAKAKKDPSNLRLLVDLFANLIPEQEPRVKNRRNGSTANQGNELSNEIRSLEVSKFDKAIGQLGQIAKCFEEVIREEGAEELDRAKRGMRRWYDASEPCDRKRNQSSGWWYRKSVYHAITYSTVVSHRRRIGLLPMGKLGCKRLRVGSWNRLVGFRKRRVAFQCFGLCGLARLCLKEIAREEGDEGVEEVEELDWETYSATTVGSYEDAVAWQAEHVD